MYVQAVSMPYPDQQPMLLQLRGTAKTLCYAIRIATGAML